MITKPETMDAKTKEKVKDLLTWVRNSCLEGEDGSWDCSTDEGKEGFIYMAENCEDIAKLLEIELDPYKSQTE